MDGGEGEAEFDTRIPATRTAAAVGVQDVLCVEILRGVRVGEQEEDVVVDGAAEDFEEGLCGGHGRDGGGRVEFAGDAVFEHEGLAGVVVGFVQFENIREAEGQVGAHDVGVVLLDGGADAVVGVDVDDVAAVLGHGAGAEGHAVGVVFVDQQEVVGVEGFEG